MRIQMHAMKVGVCALGLVASFAAGAQTPQILTNDIPPSSLSYATKVPYQIQQYYTNLVQYTTDSTLSEDSWVSLETNVFTLATGTAGWYMDYYAPVASNPIRYYRVLQFPASGPPTPTNSPGMVTIDGGPFTMGDALDGTLDAISHQVTVSPFRIDKFEVTYGLWRSVYEYATAHGYAFDHPGKGKGTNHPVQLVSWYDAVKWCNARSEMDGFTPCYYTDTAQTLVYRTGRVDVANTKVKWNAAGYRLPTEAEWEKAARGGSSGHRFPWADTEFIKGTLANYLGDNAAIRPKYDQGPVGYNPLYTSGGMPYTSPAGSFPANGYGLCDVAGNVEEWVWDWYNNRYYNATTGSIDPRGPVTSPSSSRVLRGGKWTSGGSLCRCMKRDYQRPTIYNSAAGFRCAQSIPNP
jgi:formylglycine-generating enzyme